MAEGEARAALYDLDAWSKAHADERDPGGDPDEDKRDKIVEYEVYNFAILGNIVRLYITRGTDRKVELESLIYLNQAIRSGQKLLRYPNLPKVLLEIKKHSMNLETGIMAQCASELEDWFKPIYLRYIIIMNNIVDVLGKYPDVILTLNNEATLRADADELVSIDIRCLFTSNSYPSNVEYGDYKNIPREALPHPIDEPRTRDTWEAFFDSRAVAFRGLATALGASDPTVWEKAICASLRSAIEGRKIIGNPRRLEDLADDAISARPRSIDTLDQVTNLDALARDDRNLLSQAGRDPSCGLD